MRCLYKSRHLKKEEAEVAECGPLDEERLMLQRDYMEIYKEN